MRLTPRIFAPALLAALLVLAGCQNLPSTTRHTSDPAAQSAAQPQQVQPVAIYLAQSRSDPDLIAVQVPEGTLYLQPRPIIVRDDLTDAAALVDSQGQPFVGLRLTQSGAQRLSTASRNNVGGVLALIIGRELVAAPRITGPLDQGILAFGVSSTQAAADLAARIRGDATL
ncbi:SecDF P1 head subdomain-containing protein [Castellaniella sp.]|uniref:SecDF P1 head subdomain-containing protein n=1 Tax=Castellaniella sp. TaxID=1955812 RepID=UPI002AFF0626|nr:preprotein translocase subunit SecD [Castellaniella sp.]